MKCRDIDWEESFSTNDEDEVREPVIPPSVKYMTSNDDEELKQANKSTKPNTGSPNRSEKDLHEIKDEEIYCSEVLQMLDKISVIAEKLPDQVSRDINNLIIASQQRVESVRDFVSKADIRA